MEEKEGLDVDLDRKTLDSNSLQSDIKALKQILDNVSDKHSLTKDQTISLISTKKKRTIIPSSIFRDRHLGFIEAIVKYLREEFHLSYKEISKLLKRDNRVIWVTYNKAKKKYPHQLHVPEPYLELPLEIFTKGLGPLAAISQYLHDEHKLSFKQIGDILNRDNKTIWTCYNKTKKKDE